MHLPQIFAQAVQRLLNLARSRFRRMTMPGKIVPELTLIDTGQPRQSGKRKNTAEIRQYARHIVMILKLNRIQQLEIGSAHLFFHILERKLEVLDSFFGRGSFPKKTYRQIFFEINPITAIYTTLNKCFYLSLRSFHNNCFFLI